VEAFESDFVHRLQAVHVRSGRLLYSGLCPIDIRLRVGQMVYAGLDTEHLHFFETTSAKRL
jgi:hypothetical protein